MTGDLEELAGLIHWHAGVWQDLGYENPPAGCAPIPPLGQRSAQAIKAGHEAVRDIDRLIARLHQVRAQLVSELRQDEDIRATRVDAMLARPGDAAAQATDVPPAGRCGAHHASGVTNCTLAAGHDGAHHNGSGLTWGWEAARTTDG
jgi:hypothetical protein